jgi:group I intron endonuclease
MAKVSISYKGVACIYAVLSPTNKIYIGQTWDLYHRYKSGVSKNQRLLYRSYQKHGQDSHTITTLIEFKEDATQADLDYWECYYIEAYKTEGFQLLNIREGGGNKGKLSEETKMLVGIKSRQWKKENPEKAKAIALHAAKSNIGKKRSDETKKLQSEAAKGKVWSEEHKMNISLAKKGKPSPHKGKHFSPEAVERIRAAAKSRKQNSKAILQYSANGIFIKEWPSIKEASEALSIHKATIGGCIRNVPHYKSAGGFTWRYK